MSQDTASLLVVDDNPANRDLLARRLERKGYQVTVASGGQQAIMLVESESFDLILLDIMMPDVNGMDVLETVRRNHIASELPVIMVTARDDSEDIVNALTLGANDYVNKPIDFPVLFARIKTQVALKRAEDALRTVNQILEERLAEQARRLYEAECQLSAIIANLPGLVYRRVLDENGAVHYPNLYGITHDSTGEISEMIYALASIHPDDTERFNEAMEQSARDLTPIDLQYRAILDSEKTRWFHNKAQPSRGEAGALVWDGLILDITERQNLEVQLLHAQKMEAVGQLAAGIAHEINTPTQYINDNTRFVTDVVGNLLEIAETSSRLLKTSERESITPEMMGDLKMALEKADTEYLAEEIPAALEQAQEGLSRISKIVGAIKGFSHPGGDRKEPADINDIITNTLTMARNEWKYVADVVTDFDENLPLVQCFPGEIGQVLLNLIVNAAHAIKDVVGRGSGDKGVITITTKLCGNVVNLRISDTGTGVPEELRDSIFNPFFTTKGVGKGTGQGLAIARSVIVDKHGGTLSLRSEADAGATFIIQLPLGDAVSDNQEAVA